MGYIKSLDGLRAIAVFLVILFHYRIMAFGWIGVQIFFVLSGYLITRILVAGKGQPASDYFKRFYWRRSLRIFPLYFSFLVGLTLLYLLVNVPDGLPSWGIALYSYTFNLVRPFYSQELTPINDYFFGHLWSLAVEEQFYLLWPMVIYCLPLHIIKRVVVTIMIVTPLLRLALGLVITRTTGNLDLVGAIMYYMPVFQIDAFATGAAISLIQLPDDWPSRKHMLLALNIIVLGGIINQLLFRLNAGKVFSISSLGYPIYMIDNLQYSWGYVVINVNAVLIIMGCIRQTWGYGWLEHRYLVHIGRISYGIYVFHFPLIYIFKQVLFPQAARNLWTLPGVMIFGLYVVSVVGVAQLSFTYLEHRFLRLKDRGPGRAHALLDP